MQCEEGLIPSPDISTNTTHCSCNTCDDITVRVKILVYDSTDKDPIPAAQVIDSSTGELLGLTYHNGLVNFMVPLSARNVTVHVLAANYFPRERFIKLFPTNQPIAVDIALATRRIITVTPGDSGYTFRFGTFMYITVPAGGFKKNGTIYNGLVTFDGMFMDSSEEGFLDMVDGDQFVVDGSYFSMQFIVRFDFITSEGDPLVPDMINYYYSTGVEDAGSLEQPLFLVTFDQPTQQWKRLGTLTSPTSLVTRQVQAVSRVLEASNIQFELFASVAGTVNATCWLQARTFDLNMSPAIGFIVTLIQLGNIGGVPFLYRFGSNTGSQSTGTGLNTLVTNAICLPLECSRFSLATLEGNQAIREPRNPITPIEFPPDTFGASEVFPPRIIGRVFTFGEVITANSSNPRPFYASPNDCLINGQEGPLNAEREDYFAFVDFRPPTPNSTENCFIKIRIEECLNSDANLVSVSSVDADTGIVNGQMFLPTDFQDVDDFTIFSGNDTSVPCFEAPRFVCAPYVCNNIVQVTVRDDDGIAFCNITTMAPTLQVPLLTGDSAPDMLIVRSERLVTADYNDVDLGLYFDPDPMIAEVLCEMTNNTMSLPSLSGYAARFNCLT